MFCLDGGSRGIFPNDGAMGDGRNRREPLAECQKVSA
jgi:hypothetical protein